MYKHCWHSNQFHLPPPQNFYRQSKSKVGKINKTWRHYNYVLESGYLKLNSLVQWTKYIVTNKGWFKYLSMNPFIKIIVNQIYCVRKCLVAYEEITWDGPSSLHCRPGCRDISPPHKLNLGRNFKLDTLEMKVFMFLLSKMQGSPYVDTN